MLPSFLSFVSLYTSYLRRCFTSSGLSRQSIHIDDETTISIWGPNPDHLGPPPTSKPALVLIHGFGPVCLWQWRKQVQFFAPNFRLYVPDLVFFGDSMTKSGNRTEMFQAECVAKVLEKLGVERYSVVGTSYGGMVAYQVARLWPERVEKVVVASSGVNMRRRDNEELVKKANVDNVGDLMLPQQASQLRALLGVAVANKPLFGVPDFFLNDFIRKLYAENRNEKLELLKGLTIGKDDKVNISPLEQDVLLVWGEHDRIFPLEMAHELKGLIGKEVKLEVIKNAAHVPQLEQAALFNNIIKRFLCGSS
ncbi:hypothetical protein Tsubulata_020580 [Turnera subulata]|uniref:AB hydrolase-1 domain-containing protein n=1 Tax=Turnera subulata TaxID=218843 RepID=A0A9Q0G9E2_9ROSI|nr:hypothetical protein Tsubulata_020580 [Turnera subulata]